MKFRSRRWIALLLLAATGFAQASVALADCPMERGQFSRTMAPAVEGPCETGTQFMPDRPRYANRCLAHCTADLKAAGQPVALVPSAADSPALRLLQRATRTPVEHRGLDVPPPGAPPLRILLHSFLI